MLHRKTPQSNYWSLFSRICTFATLKVLVLQFALPNILNNLPSSALQFKPIMQAWDWTKANRKIPHVNKPLISDRVP